MPIFQEAAGSLFHAGHIVVIERADLGIQLAVQLQEPAVLLCLKKLCQLRVAAVFDGGEHDAFHTVGEEKLNGFPDQMAVFGVRRHHGVVAVLFSQHIADAGDGLDIEGVLGVGIQKCNRMIVLFF